MGYFPERLRTRAVYKVVSNYSGISFEPKSYIS